MRPPLVLPRLLLPLARPLWFSPVAVAATAPSASSSTASFTSRLPLGGIRLCATTATAASTTIGYVTDVEGNLDYWRRFCRLSEVIDDSRGLADLALADDSCHLVVGGDSVDKGPGDLRFLESILNLKAKHPRNVHFVLGNRDINKMRFRAELHEAHWLAASAHPGVYWRKFAGPDGGPATPATFLAAQARRRDGEGTESAEEVEEGAGRWSRDTMANRLRWMLADNMGCPRTFEFRRAELAALRGASADGVPDDDVLASMCTEASAPEGRVRRYLEQAQLAVRVGDALFVHGGIHPDALGHLPAERHGGAPRTVDDVGEWVDALNAFARAQVRAWARDCDSGAPPAWPGACARDGDGFFDRPGGQLLAYGMATRPDGSKAPTIVYASYLVDGHPRPASPIAVRRLRAAGVRALVVGHQPHGDAPVLMRCPPPSAEGGGRSADDDDALDEELVVVTADTSFSQSTQWEALARSADAPVATGGGVPAATPEPPPPRPTPAFGNPRGPSPPAQDDPRGVAVSEVCLDVAGGRPCVVRVRGVLSDGREMQCQVDGGTTGKGASTAGDGERGALVGRTVGDGQSQWWVKGKLQGGAWLLSRGVGYDAINSELAFADKECQDR